MAKKLEKFVNELIARYQKGEITAAELITKMAYGDYGPAVTPWEDDEVPEGEIEVRFESRGGGSGPFTLKKALTFSQIVEEARRLYWKEDKESGGALSHSDWDCGACEIFLTAEGLQVHIPEGQPPA